MLQYIKLTILNVNCKFTKTNIHKAMRIKYYQPVLMNTKIKINRMD